jgi:ABC-type polysaccharide/polyol phosphate export permease
MYWLVDSYQRVLLYGLWPDWALLGRFALVALVVYALGARFLMREKRSFPDLL